MGERLAACLFVEDLHQIPGKRDLVEMLFAAFPDLLGMPSTVMRLNYATGETTELPWIDTGDLMVSRMYYEDLLFIYGSKRPETGYSSMRFNRREGIACGLHDIDPFHIPGEAGSSPGRRSTLAIL